MQKPLILILILVLQYIINILCTADDDITNIIYNNNTDINRKLPYDYTTDKNDAKNWCDYLQSTPEPDIILYNRLAKCGSTTMKMLFTTLSEQNGQFVSHSVDKVFWRDLDIDKDLRTKFLAEVNDIMAESEKLVVDGHWFHTQFSSTELKGVSFENIQLLRECKSRYHHHHHYHHHYNYHHFFGTTIITIIMILLLSSSSS